MTTNSKYVRSFQTFKENFPSKKDILNFNNLKTFPFEVLNGLKIACLGFLDWYASDEKNYWIHWNLSMAIFIIAFGSQFKTLFPATPAYIIEGVRFMTVLFPLPFLALTLHLLMRKVNKETR